MLSVRGLGLILLFAVLAQNSWAEHSATSASGVRPTAGAVPNIDLSAFDNACSQRNIEALANSFSQGKNIDDGGLLPPPPSGGDVPTPGPAIGETGGVLQSAITKCTSCHGFSSNGALVKAGGNEPAKEISAIPGAIDRMMLEKNVQLTPEEKAALLAWQP